MNEPICPLRARALLYKSIREFFDEGGFLEVATPVLVPQPGVEVHIDYFATDWRDHQGRSQNLWLRSSPELAMKSLMASGSAYERIYQIAPCFRSGGEFTKWHHPEFALLEYYAAPACHEADFDEFCQKSYELLLHTEQTFVERLRVEPLLTKNAQGLVKISVYDAFKEWANIELLDQDPGFSKKAASLKIGTIRPEDDFETAYFKVILDKIEPRLKSFPLVCLYDFPPSQAILARCVGGRAKRFEFYIKGIELCNAFWEETSVDENLSRITRANRQREELGKPRLNLDPTFVNALKKGIPSSCGNALGLDRWLALLLGDHTIDGVMGLGRSHYQNTDS